MQNFGISTGIHYSRPIHLVEAFTDLGYHKGDFPISESASREVLSLPMYAEMSFSDIDFVTDLIKKFYQ